MKNPKRKRKERRNNSELEKVIKKDLDLVTCPKKDCTLFGDYYKCYLCNEKYCGIYLNWIVMGGEELYNL